jgi:hypothetical protein
MSAAAAMHGEPSSTSKRDMPPLSTGPRDDSRQDFVYDET